MTSSPEQFCQYCGYRLKGLPEPRCPECGHAFDPQAALPQPREPSWLVAIVIGLFIALCCFGVLQRFLAPL